MFLLLTLLRNAKHFKLFIPSSMRLDLHWDLEDWSTCHTLPAHVWIIGFFWLFFLTRIFFHDIFIIKHLILKTFCRKFLHIDLIENSEPFQHQAHTPSWKCSWLMLNGSYPFLMEYSPCLCSFPSSPKGFAFGNPAGFVCLSIIFLFQHKPRCLTLKLCTFQ